MSCSFGPLHEDDPVGLIVLSGTLADRRHLIRQRQNLANRYLSFVPLEDKYAMWPQHSERFFETRAQVIAPSVFVQAPVFLTHPSVFTNTRQMRRVKYNNRERGIGERQRAEIGDNVRADN